MSSGHILVTGGAGYIGSHACKALAAAGYTPVTLDNLAFGHRDAVRWGPFENADLADRAAIERILRDHRIESVIHFAALAYVGESMTEPLRYFRNNVAGTLTLLEAMRACSVQRIVLSSTCATYGVPQAVPIPEDHPQWPVNPYGESKLAVERMLRWVEGAYGTRWMSLRYFNAAGADPDGEIGESHDPETHLIPLAIDAALGRRGPLKVMGTDYPTRDGTAIRDYIHVVDLADAHVRALRHLESGGASCALNLGTGRGHTVREVIAMIERVTGRKLPSIDSPRRPGDPAELVALPGRARDVLGWTPGCSDLETIVRTATRWHASRPPAASLRPTA
jgi:UDP-glucose-4-epimerase GalE